MDETSVEPYNYPSCNVTIMRLKRDFPILSDAISDKYDIVGKRTNCSHSNGTEQLQRKHFNDSRQSD